jgi:hypothetical protein
MSALARQIIEPELARLRLITVRLAVYSSKRPTGGYSFMLGQQV